MNQLQSMKNPIGNNKMFQILFEVAQIVLLIPHSNAAIECLFSCKQQDKTLSSILAVKFDHPHAISALCYEFQSDKELLGTAKKAVVNYNKKHSN